MNVLGAISLTLVLSFLTESMIEYFLGTPMDKIEKLKPYRWLLIYAAPIAAVPLAINYQIDLVAWIARLANVEIADSMVGFVLSGLVIGRGANYAHQFVSKYFPQQQ